jgi:PadR family transcriptional regulator, regulatory protein PadR
MMILESLRRQPAHGYALVQHIQQRSNNLLQVEEGSLYPALQRLLKAKLVKAEWGVSSTNRRVRTYQITASGLRHLEQQISSFERMFEGIALVLNPGKSPPTRRRLLHELDSEHLPPPQALRRSLRRNAPAH